jgi:N-acyl-D-amino-acid deacylase
MNVLDNKKKTRRNFLLEGSSLVAAATVSPFLACSEKEKETLPLSKAGRRTIETADPERPTISISRFPDAVVLAKGLVVDGSGRRGFRGDVVISRGKIVLVTEKEAVGGRQRIDCTNKVIMPGIIDMHSHMDWVLPMKDRDSLKTPFTEQGVSTFVGGNCGYGIAGYEKENENWKYIRERSWGHYDLKWRTFDQFQAYMKKVPMTHNLAYLAGDGTTRASMRGYDSTPMNPEEMKRYLYLIEEALEQGARGLSFGLQYEPGIFDRKDEIVKAAEVVKKHDGIMTVHMKAYSAISPTYPIRPFGTEHNLLAIRDMIDVARRTGVRMQLSHLIFVGEKTWPTCQRALEMIDRANREGLDIMFDTYAYHCGTSKINVVMPEWFLAGAPVTFESRASLTRLSAELNLIVALLGFGPEDIQITKANHPDLEKYNGMFLEEIADKRGMSMIENLVDFARKTHGTARVLNHRYSSRQNVFDMMRHPRSLFMTDATVAPEGVQNPASFGNFPLFFQYARDYGLISPEEAVRKMTGAPADRFAIKKRGYLREGYHADVLVLDWNRVKDNNTEKKTDQKPDGIDYLFINGVQVLDKGTCTGTHKGIMI